MLNIHSALSKKELQREKQKDYRNVVVIQVLIIVFGLTLSGPVLEDSTSGISKFILTLFLTFGVIYNFLLWDMFRNFTDNMKLVILFLVVLSAIPILGILGEFPYCRFIEFPNRRAYLLVLHGLLFPIEVTVIGYAIKDIFAEGYLTPDKLWGASCVFLMTGISFGSLFHLICLADPAALGTATDPGFANYSASVAYSLSILGGVDTGFPDASTLVKNIGVLEAVWSNLFALLIIGKLLGLPRQEGKN